MKRKSITRGTLVFTLILALILGLAACGGDTGSKAEEAAAESTAESTENSASDISPETEAAEGSDTAPASSEEPAEDTSSEPVHIMYGVVGQGSLDEIVLQRAHDKLFEEGVELEVTEFGELGAAMSMSDMWSFYSQAAIDEYDDQRRALYTEHYSAVGYTTCTPIRLFSAKYSSLEEIPDGARIAVNLMLSLGGISSKRVALLLEGAGLITLKDASEMPDYTSYYPEHYIKENLSNIELEIYDPEYMTEEREEIYDAFITFGDYDANLLCEDPTISDPYYWNRIMVNAEAVKDPAMLDAFEKVVEAYQSQETLDTAEAEGRKFYPVGWDVDLIAQYR